MPLIISAPRIQTGVVTDSGEERKKQPDLPHIDSSYDAWPNNKRSSVGLRID